MSETQSARDYFSEESKEDSTPEFNPYEGLCLRCLGTNFVLIQDGLGGFMADIHYEGDGIQIKKCGCKQNVSI